jgi:hypothetical protein
MKEDTGITHWASLLRIFLAANEGRATRVGVFEHEFRGVTDYWIESGLPLSGLDLETTAGDVRLTITLGNLRREVNKVSNISLRLSRTAEEEGLDVIDMSGSTTILRFEATA